MSSVLLFVYCFILQTLQILAVVLPDEQRLVEELFNKNKYDNSVRPVINASHSVVVKFGYSLIQIMDMVSIYFS